MRFWQCGLLLLLLCGYIHAGDRLHNPIKKCTESFCFDLTLLITLSGPFRFLNTTNITEHYRCVGFDEDATVEEGRRAADFFLERYGLNYTLLPDENYIDGMTTTPEPTVTDAIFAPFVIDTEEQFRLVFASTRYNFDSPDLPVKAAFWCVFFGSSYASTGTFNETIPPGAAVCYGSYIIELCKHRSHFCFTFLKSRFPYRPLFIRTWTLDFLVLRGPSPFQFQAENLAASLDGQGGLNRGLFYVSESLRSDRVEVFDGHTLLTFPGLAPLENDFEVRDDRFTCSPKNGQKGGGNMVG